MTQLDLFDDPPASRLTDPATSKAAEQTAKAAIRTARDKMLEAFMDGPKTANEAAADCVRWYGGNHETYRKRSGELADAGLIRVCDTRACRVTGHHAEVWKEVQ